MKRISLSIAFLMANTLLAGPTSVFWTNCSTDIQETGTAILNVVDYFTVYDRRGHGSMLPSNVGILAGIFEWNDIKAEAGIDFFGGTDDPLFFNFKIGVDEDKLFCNAPAFNVGIFNIGSRHSGHGRTDQNVVDFIIGKSLPDSIGGNIYAAYYSGSKALGKDTQGYMVAWLKEFCPAKDCDGTVYNKWFLAADYASGNNAIGGGGVAIGYYFRSNVYIETGPVFFNSAEINGTWKWGVQMYVTFPVFKTNRCSGK